MTEPETPETNQPDSYIKISFPAGPHNTGITLQMAYVDTAQMEIAGRFLIRQAEAMYTMAAQQQQQTKSGLMIPQPGSIKV
jgi:hypothetical protein